jgi:poly-beta-1,6-N-acetyl-D-glucosamine biosynthesis protein PgaD
MSAGPWPPIISARRLPWWLLTRDALLTLLAWGALLWLVQRPVRVAWDYLFVAPHGQLTREAPIDWAGLATMLQPFTVVAAALVAWVLAWALLRLRPLRSLEPKPQPQPLTAAEQAMAFGIDAGDLLQWQQQKVSTARFDTHNRLSAMPPQGGP